MPNATGKDRAVISFPASLTAGAGRPGAGGGDYVELSAMTNYSFLEAASHADELAVTAAALGMRALGIADRNSLAGIVRAHVACRKAGIRLVVGCRLSFRDAPDILAYPASRATYGRLCELLTLGRRRAPKGECHLDYADFAAVKEGFIAILVPSFPLPDIHTLHRFRADFGDDGSLALAHLYRGDDLRRLRALRHLADEAGLGCVAINEVRHHIPSRKTLLDVLACVRHGCTIDNAGYRLEKNAERHLKPADEMRRLFRGNEDAVARTVEVTVRCTFSLDELRYEYPDEVMAPGESAMESLTRLAREGAAWRYPDGVPDKVRQQVDHELKLVGKLGYAPYFLTVRDIVHFARQRGILHQGRGSAANSAVCYCLGVTAVDPAKSDLLFERFISEARNEPPDIDIDFEHERREEVIQYIYEKYGRHRTGLTAVVTCYRARGAIRDVGRALGLSEDVIGRLSKTVWGWSAKALADDQVRAAGLDPGDRRLMLAVALARELMGTPRHLSQHVGGFVISRGPLSSLVPIENAAMAGRTVIQWDKDDLDTLGLLKVDVLALGMLTCIRKAFDLIARHHGRRHTLASVPPEDSATYEMLCRADSVGVFQVESRAQMSMLPRLRPRCFYDLVIEVAIVRPGPIQGDMVHPYLRRRDGLESSAAPSPELEAVLRKTKGVPLFQEQVMKIAMVAAGFTASEADELRRAMATFRKLGTIQNFRDRFVAGMLGNGYQAEFAERCFKQVEGFGNYGFPESHAASFALLVYVSAWLKCHHPAEFAAALLNSQPMGFYAPAQIVRDAAEHGVETLPADINRSNWDNGLEPATAKCRHPLALRLGLRQVNGLREPGMQRLVDMRGDCYRSVADLWRRSGLAPAALAQLAGADCFRSLGLDRRQALWSVKALGETPLPLLGGFEDADSGDEPVPLPEMPLSQHVIEDYRTLRLSLRKHPVAFLRGILARRGARPCRDLGGIRNGQRVFVAGLVLVRQRPGTASGVIFMTLEDESGIANLVVWPRLFSQNRATVMGSSLLGCSGRVQVEGRPPHQVIHVVAERLLDMSDLLATLEEDAAAREEKGGLAIRSRDFH